MNKKRMISIFNKIDSLSVGVLGDLCIDMYWEADLTKSLLSRETPHYTLPVIRESISLGGACNVLSNIAALRPRKVFVIGVIGNDWRSILLKDALQKVDADMGGIVTDSSRFTTAFIKPLRKGLSETVYEDPRLDFEVYAPLSKEIESILICTLDRIAPSLDILCVCDQLAFGCVTSAVRERLSALSKAGLTVIADSRERIGLFENVIIKPNDIEACRAFDLPIGASLQKLKELTQRISQKHQRPAYVTLGDNGCLSANGSTATHVPAVPVSPPIDICGAGDTFLSALACALGANATAIEAAELANLASSLTIKQLHTTGTVTREAMLAALNSDFS